MSQFIEKIWLSLWWDNSTEGRIIIAVILAISLSATLKALGNLSRYRKERQQLSKVAEKLDASVRVWMQSSTNEEANETDTRPDDEADKETRHEAATEALPSEDTSEKRSASHSAPSGTLSDEASTTSPWASLGRTETAPRVDLQSLQDGLDKGSLIYQRLRAIGKMRRHQVKVNLSTLQHLTEAKELAQPGLASAGVAVGVTMMLGILGTFLGLVTMVQEIQLHLPNSKSLDMESWTQAFGNISTVLGGIKTAFSTSLVGMTCATFLTLLKNRLAGAQAVLIEELERFTTEDLLPSTVPSVEDESLLERVSLQLEASFVRLEKTLEQNQTVLSDLSAIEQAFLDILEEIRLITKSEASRDFEKIIDALGETNSRVSSVVGALPGVVEAMEARQATFLKRFSPWQQTLSGLAALWGSTLLGLPAAVLFLIAAALLMLSFANFFLDIQLIDVLPL